MTDPAKLAALIDPLVAARATRRRRALADPHTLRLAAIFLLATGAIAASGTHYLAAGLLLLVGVWAVAGRIRTATRLPLAVGAHWLTRVIDMDLTAAGRQQLTLLLMHEALTPEELIPWGRAEIARQRTVPTQRCSIPIRTRSDA